MKRMVLLAILTVMLAACGKAESATTQVLPDPNSIGNPDQGKVIFDNRHDDAPACITCHSVDGAPSPVGPSLYKLPQRAGLQVDGLSAVDYIRQSIVDPDAFIADGKSISTMYKNFDEALTEEQINDLIAYLLTLK